MSTAIVVRCGGTSCTYHPVLGSILPDHTVRILVRSQKVHVRSGEVLLGCRECGFEQVFKVSRR